MILLPSTPTLYYATTLKKKWQQVQKILNVAKWQSGKVAVSVLSCVLPTFTPEFGGILQKSAPYAMLKFGGSKYYS